MQKPFSRSKNAPPAAAAAKGAGLAWHALKYFLAVARAGGLSRAALELGSSPATVSRHVSALEDWLGVRLFVRLQTGLLLTDEGSELFERVGEVERSTLVVERRGRSGAGGEVAGLVRLAASESIGTRLLAPRMAELYARHPGLRIELLLSPQRADLARREADLALRYADPQTDGSHEDHVAHPVGAFRFAFYAARSLVQRAGTEDLERLDYIAWASDSSHLTLYRWQDQFYAGREPAFSCNSLDGHLAAARGGLGVAMLPGYLAADDPLLQRLPSAEEPPPRMAWLVYHRDLKTSRRVQAVRAFVEEVIGEAALRY